ncbi:Eukaryotic translation initiation factor 3 subunit F [Taenia crassiceps]|uniref:Eukaryotic translation initiation factor 3 subunit F n=1 Tax=Taenia crassiceps TaxID=6207 RepID=A0ABR4Q766_9CEST
MEDVAKVHVHPVVLLSIIDSYERRNEDAQNVVGTLLGTFEKGIIEVTHSFSVPHKESKTDVSMDFEFGRAMLNLERKVNRNLRPVGWYATGSEVTESSLLIHQDYYMKHVKNPIFLLVNPNLEIGKKMSIQAFQSRTIGIPDGTMGTMFLSLEVNLEFFDTERCAVDMMVADSLTKENQLSEAADDLSYLYKLTGRLLSMLERVNKKVEAFANGEQPADSELGMAIARLIFSTPKLDSDNVEDLISSSFKDLLMVTYLTNLIRSHTKLLSLAH